MPNSYNKKTVLVTGGSRGLGAATIKKYAQEGYNVVINYNFNEQKALELKNEVETKYGIKALTIKCDISNEKEVLNMIDIILKEFDTIDILINNAGIAIDSTLEDKTVDNFKKILNVNLIGTFITCKHIGKIMKEQGFGSIVNISSTNGIDANYPYSMDYDASKAGVISLTHNFAELYAPTIRVNCIAPGWINTEMNKELGKEYIEEESKNILLNRFAEPEEIAEVIYFTSISTYLDDAIIKVNGGGR